MHYIIEKWFGIETTWQSKNLGYYGLNIVYQINPLQILGEMNVDWFRKYYLEKFVTESWASPEFTGGQTSSEMVQSVPPLRKFCTSPDDQHPPPLTWVTWGIQNSIQI